MAAAVCRAVLAAAAAAAIGAPAAGAAVPGFTPPLHRDAAEHRHDPLDLRAAAFGQVGTQLSLTLRTRGPRPTAGSLCVTLVRDAPLGKLCLAAKGKRTLVQFRERGRLKPVPGAQATRSGSTFRALVYPRALGLRPGPLRWFVQSRGSRGFKDRLPDSGTLSARVSVYGAPACFGAAARAGDSACPNPALERLVTPAPADAELMTDLRCRPHHVRRYAPAIPCSFGAGWAPGPARLALIGDSHAMSFRATTEVAAQALGLKVVGLTRAGCAFATDDVYDGWPHPGKACLKHTEQVLRWLRDHPAIKRVVLTQSAIHGYTEGGLAKLWSRIPGSVRNIYVVVDVPRVTYRTAGCVSGVRKRHAVSDGACALPRDEKTLPPDPAAGAVAKSAPRVHLVDLTRFFCDAEHCFPVIGGAYVYRDTNHMNTTFAQTLGPYLLEAMGAG